MNDWSTIVKENTPLVWQITYRLVGNQADAADCFQETFLSALKIAKAEPIKSWSALLRRLATTRALDRLRQKYRYKAHCQPQGSWSEPTDVSAEPDRLAQQQELRQQLRYAVAQLPSDQAEAFCLRFLDQLTNRQIARLMNITPNNIGVLIHRARQQLQKTLETVYLEYQG